MANLRFRNYKPQTDLLEGMYIKQTEPETIVTRIQDKLELLDESAGPVELEPKKVDWDLKQRLQERLARLDRQTQKQIKTRRGQ